MYWSAEQTLIVADIHLGKAASFRSAGVPVPGGTTRANLNRLSTLLDQTRADRLLLLGDFMHAAAGRLPETMQIIRQWRDAHHNIEITLVRGNHDHSAGDPPPHWHINCVDEPWNFNGITFRHHPVEGNELVQPTIAGHLHPRITLRDLGDLGTRLPCFWITANQQQMILPAFGHFTGGWPIDPQPTDRVFPISPDAVHELPAGFITPGFPPSRPDRNSPTRPVSPSTT